VTLAGSGVILPQGNSVPVFATDTWKTLILPRAADGSLTGQLNGLGEEMISEGDVIWQADLAGAGTFVKDATDPELRTTPIARGPVDSLFPWDPIPVALAEPLDGPTVEQSIHIDAPGASLPIAWDAPSSTWAGATSLTARLTDWSRVTSSPWSVSHAGGVADRVGRMTHTSSATVMFLGLGPAVQQVGFDSDVLLASFWGTAGTIGGGLTGQADPRCEHIGCALMGPFDVNACSMPRAGFAGELVRGAGQGATVRYRILAEPGSGSGSPMVFMNPFVVELATQGLASTIVEPLTSSPTFTQLSAPIDGLSWATPWTDLDAKAPPGTGPIGFAVRTNPGTTSGNCGGGPPFPPVKVEVLIEAVTAK
jgi:hypothetical protein